MDTRSKIIACLVSFAVLAAGLGLLTAIQNEQASKQQNNVQALPVLANGQNAYVLLPAGYILKAGTTLKGVTVMLQDGSLVSADLPVTEEAVAQQAAMLSKQNNGKLTPAQEAMRDPTIAAMVAKGHELGYQGKPIKTALEDGSPLVVWVDDPYNIEKGTQAKAVLKDLTSVTVTLELVGDPSKIIVLEP